MKKTRKRLDHLLVERGLFETRAKAQAAVMAGQVLVAGVPETKAGTSVADDCPLELVKPCPYVSRGGLKLEAALAAFKPAITGRVCLDVGASTGGFTDCLLQKGAAMVYAIDVGTAQLDAKLKADSRVVSREQTHARDLRPAQFDPRPDLAVLDVSFISLNGVLPFVVPCLKTPLELIALVKPQFELSPKQTPKGVVRKPEDRAAAVEKVRAFAKTLGLEERGIVESPVHGPKGNIETFLYLSQGRSL
jgi:23S rRNA (cytidine1920-2'-O)/16S rRNA (cytidine1409-2'-O)-methyltransferase